MRLATAMWLRLETVHAVTYFAPECAQGFADAGLRGFWMGYFGGRAAPMGPVAAPVVAATFFNFHRSMVERAIPDAWTFSSPATALDVRAVTASVVLHRACPEADDLARRAVPMLRRAIGAASFDGRPLAAANAEVELGHDPVIALWQCATTLREHRGDGHVAVLTSLGLSGCEVHVLQAAYRAIPAERLQKARGWSADEWAASVATLLDRGWLHADGSLTGRGRDARDDIERRTDELAAPPYAALGDAADGLLTLLTPLRDAVLDADVISFPNPIGLPRDRA